MSLTFQEKVKRCNAFWTGAPVERPMIGFSLGGWFPFQEYTAMRKFRGQTRPLTADQIVPAEFMKDYDNIVAQWEEVDDDVIRSVAPIAPFPWLESMLGSAIDVGEDSVWAREGDFDFADINKLDFSESNPWRRKYLEFAAALKGHFGDRVPIGQPIMRGVSDLIAALRTSTRMIFDLYDHGEEILRLGRLLTAFMVKLVKDQQDVTGPFNGGYCIEQYTLWAPGRILRMQEDASALVSPDLFDKFLKEEERRQAAAFPYSLIHLHTSSLFLVDRICTIEPLKCLQINKDAGKIAVPQMIPYLKGVQGRGKKLLVRGKLTRDDLALLRQSLSPAGLFLQIVVESAAETKELKEFVEPWI